MSRSYADEISSPQHQAKWRRNAGFFKACRQVVDLGCGPGHFLATLKAAAIPAYGVDLEAASLAACKSQGLKVQKKALLPALKALKAGRVDGIHCSNVMEHLPVAEALNLIALAAVKLGPGGKLILSTANPACLGVLASDFWQDGQHVRFYPWQLLRQEAEAAGLVVDFAGGDECTRPQGPLRWALRRFRSLLVGPYFGPPEVLLLAHKP